MSSPKFNFNKELLERFIKTAQPYFLPISVNNSRWKLIALIALAILSVISISHFFLIFLGFILEIVFPTFINELAPQFKVYVDSLKNNGLVITSLIILSLSSYYFFYCAIFVYVNIQTHICARAHTYIHIITTFSPPSNLAHGTIFIIQCWFNNVFK